MTSRDEMRRIAAESIAQGDATGWFERFYRQAGGDWDQVPWADRRPHPTTRQRLRIGAAPNVRSHATRNGFGRRSAQGTWSQSPAARW